MAETPTPSEKRSSGVRSNPEPGSSAPGKGKAPGYKPELPRQIGKYEILKKIGAGGMGAVYLAADAQLGRQVALKVLPKDKATNPTLVMRFMAEAKAAAALKHDNIVTIFEADEADGLHFIALEFVDGTDVANLIDKRGLLSVKRSLSIIRQVARALEHAHSKGIVHRDIKPANLLIRRDGVVKLTDLGLARALDEAVDTSITRPGTTVGTVDYMAPEQAMSSRKADVRSDIYSLGCTWYHMLTGEPPFPDGGMTNKLAAHAKAAVPDPRNKNPKVPDAIVAVVNRMMAKSPEQRYQTPTELLEDLENPGISPKSLMDAWNEGDDSPASLERKGAASEAGGEARPGLPPRGGRKGKPPGDTDYSKIFLGVMTALFVGLAVGVVWVVNKFSSVDLGGGGGDPSDVVRPKDILGEQANEIGPGKKKSVNPNITDDGSALLNVNKATNQSASPARVEIPGSPSDGLGPSAAVREFLPRWASEQSDVSQLPVLRVQTGSEGGEGRFATLNAALEAVPPTGAVIQLVGRGPFALWPQSLSERGLIVIQPSEDAPVPQQPLIVGIPGPQTAAHLLSLAATSLQLRRVHLVLDAGSWNAGLPAAIVQVSGGDLSASQCSVTLMGEAATNVQAFQVEGSLPAAVSRTPPGQLRVHLTQVVSRGRNLTGLSLPAERVEGIVQSCLFSSGIAPAVRLSGPPDPRADAGRVLRIATSTICSEKTAFFLGGSAERPLRTSIRLLDSVVAAPAGASAPPLLALDGWDAVPARDAFAKVLEFEFRNTLLTGWDRAAASPTGFNISTLSEWTKLASTRCKVDAARLEPAPWPAQIPTLDSDLALFSLVSLKTSVRSTANKAPGCPLEAIGATSLEGLEQARPLASRLPPPALFASQSVGEGDSLAIDLTREDLGKVLAGQKLRDGMEIVARGFGPRTSSPIQVNGVWIRLRLEQAAGAPLTLAPRSVPPGRDSQDDAFITVKNGGLHLADANIVMAADQKAFPHWLIQVNNGDLSIQRCRLQGPMVGTTRTKGVIQWVRTAPGKPARPFAGDKEGYLLATDTYLSGAGTLIEADLRQRALFLRNCVAAARDDLFSLSLGGPDAALAGAVDLEHCTLSAAGTYFNVLPAALAGPATQPLELFVDRCVFAPSLRIGSQRPQASLMKAPAAVLAQKQVAWWERKTAYSSELSVFLRDPADMSPAEQKFDADWSTRWSSGAVVQPLVGPDAVLLQAEFPAARTKLEPAHFTLDPSCGAAKWADGKPVGADIPGMKLTELSKAVVVPVKPTTRKPGF